MADVEDRVMEELEGIQVRLILGVGSRVGDECILCELW